MLTGLYTWSTTLLKIHSLSSTDLSMLVLDGRSESDLPEQDVSSTTSDSDGDDDKNEIVDYIVL